MRLVMFICDHLVTVAEHAESHRGWILPRKSLFRLVLQLCNLSTSRLSSHRGRNGFSPHKKVPVQSHNSFLDQRSQKVIV